MIFISKMIFDPVFEETRRTKMGNLMGLTIGLTFHTPKFWDCHKHDFYTSQFDDMRGALPLSEKEMERRYIEKWAHSKCKRKHMSYRGYMYWTGPKRRYDFRYMGRTASWQKWWKPFSVRKHGRYVRLLDNGPQFESTPVTRPELDPVLAAHRDKWRESLSKARAQMEEYERVRGPIG